MATNVIHYEFENKSELYNILQQQLNKLCQNSSYNLYVHKAYDFDENGKYGARYTARNNTKSIIRNGLSLSKYSSIQQTAAYKGKADISKTDVILNYDYPWSVSEQAIVIVAIPKNIEINGYEIDFSTPQFTHADYESKRKDLTCNQYTMAYDALDYFFVHKEFVLGAIITNFPYQTEQDYLNQGKKYEIYLNENHFSKMTKQEQQLFLKPLTDDLIKKFNINSNDNSTEIIDKITKGLIEKDKVNYRQGTVDYDFDF